MKKQLILITGAGLVLGAFLLVGIKFASQPAEPKPASITTGIHKKVRSHPHAIAAVEALPLIREREQLQSVHEEKANLFQWLDRMNTLVVELGSRDAALTAVLAEVDSAYGTWVNEEIADLAKLPAADRYDRLAVIETELRDGVAAILEQLGMDENPRNQVAPLATEIITAEIQYAEMAPNPESRLAMLRLDRERQTRLEQALAITDESTKSQAIAELDGWYDAGVGSIFATPER